MKRILFLLLFLGSLASYGSERPKYIFYFIGDGMGHNALALTEACLAEASGDSVGFSALHFTQFPTVGFATTWCANRRTTDSAAAGTALATGQKKFSRNDRHECRPFRGAHQHRLNRPRAGYAHGSSHLGEH